MTLWKSFTRRLGVLALLASLAAPVALADHHRGHGYHGDRHGKHYRDRGYRYEGRHHRGYHGDRRHHRDHWKHRRGYGHDWKYHRGYRHYRPHYSYWGHHDRWRYYKHAPRYHPRYTYRPRIIHRPHYAPRYHVGGYYHYHPRTIILYDHGRYGLGYPPHGYHWVRDPDRNDAFLASIATGAIIGLAIGALAD